MGVLRSLRVRLTLWYVVLLAVTLGIFSGALYFAMRESVYSNLDDSLDSRAAFVAGLVTNDGALDTSDPAILGDPVDDEEYARIYDASGELVLENIGEAEDDDDLPPVDADAVSAALEGRTTRRGVRLEDEHLRALTAPIRTEDGIVGVVEVGLSEEGARETLTALLVIIAVAYPLALVVASAGGVFLAGRALSPIDRVTRVARRITAEDLSQRLDLRLPDDEVGRLARTFDEMIARLDEAFKRQRQFTADASHELRTPLTAIKGQTEVALQRDREPEDYRQVLRIVNTEVDRMIRLVGSLLTLARADAAQIPVNRERLHVEAVVRDAAGQIGRAAADTGIALTVLAGDDVEVTADEDLLLQLLLNLLDNAVKYTPGGGSIEVSWRRAGGQAEIAVSDTGPGIPAADLPHIFERFYRVDRARSRAEGGAGLGLSISRWIAEAHGGTITAESPPGRGATFTVRLPAA